MEDLNFGPNGGLVYCMEYLIQNLDWLRDEVGDYDDDYLIIDCPGKFLFVLQISHTVVLIPTTLFVNMRPTLLLTIPTTHVGLWCIQ